MCVYALVRYEDRKGPILMYLYEDSKKAEEHKKYLKTNFIREGVDYKVEKWLIN